METGGKIGTKLKAFCSNCRGDRNCDVAGYHSERGEDGGGNYQWHTGWYLLVCCGCEHVFAQSISTDSESYYYDYNSQGEQEAVHEETIRTWPAKFKRERPEWFIVNGIATDIEGVVLLDQSLSELYGALDHDLKMLAAIGVRTSFDIAAEILGIDAGLPFQQKLDNMVTRKLIKDSEREHLDVLIDAGSASAHRGWRPSVDDLDVLMDTLEGFIYDSFVVPTRKKAAAAKIARMKAKVPPRPKKAKATPKQAKQAPKSQT
ncbi:MULTISPECIES: DUF4145 domain-containing protein [unclassified Mesorhizobium]|uniref:DUF4145 domain-containing protein n=1 Tax=unclassified Mesorhizobium TaxID=325217 RepID=UPI00333A501A